VSAPQSPPPHLAAFLARHGIAAEFLAPGVPMPTVTLAAQAIGVPEAQILKTLVFAGDDGRFVVAIASGNDRVDRQRLAAVASVARLRAASPADVLRVTGYPAGGVAPLGLPDDLTVVVDAATAQLAGAYGGGGREDLLMRVEMADVIRCNEALVADIRQAGAK
jgi:Cys-tRNA(Pro) deacylase